ncbi:GRAM domain-containing protein 2B isoform X5 [Macaca thibetana thibetana]|uniref:GRAM domain-containing protein 3 isoform X5 n=1 Tax=Cercocebus atys TaxID=9531 RepID=UPI0003ABAF3E|nr:GRAM domain-containing protein 2B isoform X7 [Macaca fascicularis]XP_011945489.1 PREDICTED: GRAM domain-containing protein 3 isoform X5 [Cercocebus atys]XP_017815313.1 GRAM domain-containing protein 2B isoform X5 [Papio anubis]XP_025243998.1 GRAM domain-containing protein 2B isoform X5 [Theropithecus gelada]XP_050650508.1 GRAM domain-containing protein 2B isoform X5 [Macaca thibetana thibetana]
MTELQQDVEDTKPAKVLGKRESKVGSAHSEAENGVEEKKKACRSPTAQSPTPSVEADSPDQKKIISLRSKSSFDGASLASDKNDCKTESKNDPKTERKKSSSSGQYKANMHFHKLFLSVPTEEPLKQSFTCALQKEILYQGKLFVSENWICFHSKVFGKDTKISIPAFSVTLIKKTKTALLVPNALIIATVTDRYIFVSLLSRDSTYKLLKSVCGHLENTSVGNSPNPSSAENSFRADRPSSLPLDFNDEFSDLDGVVQQRRQDMEGYSSSGSQTPESENSRVDFHVTESQTVLNVSKGEAKPTRADAHVNRVPEGKAKSLPAQGLSETVGILHKVKSQKCPMLHHILIFYAIVVCALIISTFYMRYRINTLEEQLGLLTSIVDTHNTEQAAPSGLGSQVQFNVEVLCQELTANIVKLEKIQNNLQKLLENGD